MAKVTAGVRPGQPTQEELIAEAVALASEPLIPGPDPEPLELTPEESYDGRNEKLARLVERLGVEPIEHPSESFAALAADGSGTWYALEDILNAVLDRLASVNAPADE